MSYFYNTASTSQGRAACFCSPQIPQNQHELHLSSTKAPCKCQFMLFAPQNPDFISPTRWYLIFQIFMLYASGGGLFFVLFWVWFLFSFWFGFAFLCFSFCSKKQNNNNFYFEEWERFFKMFSNKKHWKRSFSSGLLLVSTHGASQSMAGTRKVQFLCSGISKNSLIILSHKLWIWFNRNDLLISLFCQCWDCRRALLFLL